MIKWLIDKITKALLTILLKTHVSFFMKIRSHKELDVYKLAFSSASLIFEVSQKFPVEEKYSLTDQIRRSSRSVCANLAEAFSKRRYPKSFVYKLSDSEAEAAETQTWLDFALHHKYILQSDYDLLYTKYKYVIGKLVKMSLQAEKWCY